MTVVGSHFRICLLTKWISLGKKWYMDNKVGKNDSIDLAGLL